MCLHLLCPPIAGQSLWTEGPRSPLWRWAPGPRPLPWGRMWEALAGQVQWTRGWLLLSLQLACRTWDMLGFRAGFSDLASRFTLGMSRRANTWPGFLMPLPWCLCSCRWVWVGRRLWGRAEPALLSLPPLACFKCSPDLEANSTEQTRNALLSLTALL